MEPASESGRSVVPCRTLGRGSRVTALSALPVLADAGCVPAVPKVASPPGGTIPRPQPAANGTDQVGTYYFPGWPSREKGQVLAAFPERTPSPGHYREGDPVAKRRELPLIEAWNEYGESAVIKPHRERGFFYLDAVRDVCGASRGRHRDLIPGHLGLTVPTAP